jgi:hypothetical protein
MVRSGWLLVAVLAVGACSSGDERGSGVNTPSATLPLAAEALDDPEVTTVATNLAPSQQTASTVAPPETPEQCLLDDIEMWTAQVRLGPTTIESVIRVRNVSDTWCEADIGRSPRLDPLVEPDVWLEPGDTADLIAGGGLTECSPSLFRYLQIAIGSESVVIGGAVVNCQWWLNAFYPNERIDVPCTREQLELVSTQTALVVKNSSVTGCVFGGITGADGAIVQQRESAAPAITELLPGDVVQVGWAAPSVCVASVNVTNAMLGVLVFDDAPCGATVALGMARPWYGSSHGPLAEIVVPESPETIEEVLLEVFDAMDVFARS